MKPKTRLENFLAKIAKDPDATVMDPKTRKEQYLDQIAQNDVPELPAYTADDAGKALTVLEGESVTETVEIVPLQVNGVIFGGSPNLTDVNTTYLTDGMTAHVVFDLWDHHPIVSVETDVYIVNHHDEYIAEVSVYDGTYDLTIDLTNSTVSGIYTDDHEQTHTPMGAGYSMENFRMTAEVSMPVPELGWVANPLPEASAQDNGKVVMVNLRGEYVLSKELPDVTQDDDGCVLEVVHGDWNVGGKSVVYIDENNGRLPPSYNTILADAASRMVVVRSHGAGANDYTVYGTLSFIGHVGSDYIVVFNAYDQANNQPVSWKYTATSASATDALEIVQG